MPSPCSGEEMAELVDASSIIEMMDQGEEFSCLCVGPLVY